MTISMSVYYFAHLILCLPCYAFSGLDSLTCFQCVSILKSLAQEGRAIICVIHQPSSSIFEMFDQLYLLADGQCIYQGPTANVITSIEKTTGLVCPIYHSAVKKSALFSNVNQLIFLNKLIFFYHRRISV